MRNTTSFQLLNYEDVLLVIVLCDGKLNIHEVMITRNKQFEDFTLGSLLN